VEGRVEGFVALLVVACAAAAVWFIGKPDALFVVRFSAGNAVATSGKVTASFLGAVGDVCREFALRSAELRGVAQGRRIALRFSAQFPPAARQRLRNWWAEYGWSAPAPVRRK
jgi:hypothetical protein